MSKISTEDRICGLGKMIIGTTITILSPIPIAYVMYDCVSGNDIPDIDRFAGVAGGMATAVMGIVLGKECAYQGYLQFTGKEDERIPKYYLQ